MVGAGLRADKPVSSIYCIEDHSFNWYLLHETTLFHSLLLLLFLCLFLLLLFSEVSLGPDGSIKEIDMREYVIEHIREIFDIILISKALLRP